MRWILRYPVEKAAFFPRKKALVQVPYPPLDRIAPPRTRPQTPAKQGFFHARAKWLAAPCEAKRQATAAHFAALLRSDLRFPADSAALTRKKLQSELQATPPNDLRQ